MTKRVFISATKDRNLRPRPRGIKRALIAKVQAAGLEPQEFLESGLAESLPWTFENVDQVMRRCLGAVILGFPRWDVGGIKLINDFSHYETAVAITQGLPVLILAERGVQKRATLAPGGGKAITLVPADASPDWLASLSFVKRWDAWLKEVNGRKDVFLGYSSKSAGVAAQIHLRLTRYGASVLYWEMDFGAGRTILREIDRASSICTCGIFLFSEDDALVDAVAAPRDNVVFEAGYFMSSKGPDRCLIIRAGKAKMPADVGGTIYLRLGNDGNVNAIE